MSNKPEIIVAVDWPAWRLWASMAWRLIRRRPAVFIRQPGMEVRDAQVLVDRLASSAHQYEGAIEELRQVEQTLGRALGYPEFGPADFDGKPNAPGHDICVGGNTAASLADEAAELIARDGRRIENFLEMLLDYGRLESKVREILLQRDDDHCCLDWGTIYPELAAMVGIDDYRPRVLPPEAMLRNCRHFIDCFAAHQPYVAPVVTEEESARLRSRIAELEQRCDDRLASYLNAACYLGDSVVERMKLEDVVATLDGRVASLVGIIQEPDETNHAPNHMTSEQWRVGAGSRIDTELRPGDNPVRGPHLPIVDAMIEDIEG